MRSGSRLIRRAKVQDQAVSNEKETEPNKQDFDSNEQELQNNGTGDFVRAFRPSSSSWANLVTLGVV